MWLTFLGAAGIVTGSRLLVEHDGRRLLVDCGMFQGDRDLRRRNWAPFPVPPADLDAVVVSHAHLDHVGWLPRLVTEGFAGPVYCSPHTAELGAIVLRDAAHLQEEDAEYAARKGFSKHHPPLPLFDTAAAEKAISMFTPIGYEQPTPVGPDFDLRLHRAGHILGSAVTEVHAGGQVLVTSGDLGRPDHPLLRPPDPPPAADVIVVESTYGDRRRPPRTLDRMATALSRTLGRGGSVLIPAFAVDRTAVVLMALRELMASGRIPRVPVFVDSPMALAALDVYRRALRDATADVREFDQAGDPFDPGMLRVAHTVSGSMALNNPRSPCVIVSAAGMATPTPTRSSTGWRPHPDHRRPASSRTAKPPPPRPWRTGSRTSFAGVRSFRGRASAFGSDYAESIRLYRWGLSAPARCRRPRHAGDRYRRRFPMSTYRIVVGVDGSDAGNRALEWACREVERRGGVVQAVIAWIWDGIDGAVVAKTHPSEERARAERMLADAVDAVRMLYPDVAIASEAIEGAPVRVLTRAAEQADLLVLGSHGHGRVFHAVLGSVAEECIRAGTCPVLIVPVPRAERVPAAAAVQPAQS